MGWKYLPPEVRWFIWPPNCIFWFLGLQWNYLYLYEDNLFKRYFLKLRVSFAYCGTGTYIFLHFSKSFTSAYFVCYLFESSFNHGIWLGHCVPNSCRSLGPKKFLTNRVISDTSEKNFIQVWKKWVAYEDGKVFPWIFVFQKIKMCCSKNTRDFVIRELIKIIKTIILP